MQLATRLDRFVKDRQLGMILMAPFEVYLSDAAPVLQPDVLFIASERVPEPGAWSSSRLTSKPACANTG